MRLELAILWEDGMWNSEFHDVKEEDENKAQDEAASVFGRLIKLPGYRNAVGFALFSINDPESVEVY